MAIIITKKDEYKKHYYCESENCNNKRAYEHKLIIEDVNISFFLCDDCLAKIASCENKEIEVVVDNIT